MNEWPFEGVAPGQIGVSVNVYLASGCVVLPLHQFFKSDSLIPPSVSLAGGFWNSFANDGIGTLPLGGVWLALRCRATARIGCAPITYAWTKSVTYFSTR